MTAAQFFAVFFLILLSQRLGELWLAKRNSSRILSQGGYEVGRNHYKYIVLIHIGFLLSLLIEVLSGVAKPPSWWPLPFIVLVITQILRYWCIVSLRLYWNTRIFIVPGSGRIRKGPYRWLSHPNYLIVLTEFIVIPLIFGAYKTVVIWSVINFAFLKFVRIPVEERALEAAVKNTFDN